MNQFYFNNHKSSNILVSSLQEYLLSNLSSITQHGQLPHKQPNHYTSNNGHFIKTQDNQLAPISRNSHDNQYLLFPERQSPFYQSQINSIEHAHTLSPTSTHSSSCSLSPTNSIDTRVQTLHRESHKKQLPIRSAAIDINELLQNAKNNKCSKNVFCSFCKNNNETEQVYRSHSLKDTSGKIVCPILKLHKCPTCGASGEQAHTITYCKKYQTQRKLEILKRSFNNL
jgi:hypothetical protein